MSDALITGIFSIIGIVVTAVVTNSLIKYRLEQLEKKVDKHNNLIDRMYKVEGRLEVIDEDIKVANHRIADLEEEK